MPGVYQRHERRLTAGIITKNNDQVFIVKFRKVNFDCLAGQSAHEPSHVGGLEIYQSIHSYHLIQVLALL